MHGKLLIIVQARMGSKRLPGKTMMQINGKPLLYYLINTIRYTFFDAKIVVATSKLIENDIIRTYCDSNSIEVYSGSETNVASRFNNILLNNLECENFIRFCGDSPFFDTKLLQKSKKMISNSNDFEIITTKFSNAFPLGSNLEVLKSKVFLNAYSSFSTASHFEHVTPYFYENIGLYKTILFDSEDFRNKTEKYKLSVDTQYDFNQAEFLLEKMNYCPWTFSLDSKYAFIDEYTVAKRAE